MYIYHNHIRKREEKDEEVNVSKNSPRKEAQRVNLSDCILNSRAKRADSHSQTWTGPVGTYL